MSFFDFFKNKSTSKDSIDASSEKNTDLWKYENHEFEKIYGFSVEVYDMYTETTEIIEGEITFHDEVYWDELYEIFNCEVHTNESTGRFQPDEFTGNDGQEDQFFIDYKNYLINQGVNENLIGW